MARYQYKPLQFEDSIRILVLHPSPNEQDYVQCTLQHARLSDEDRNYEAVSYTWGSPEHLRIIRLDKNTSALLVTVNCENALRRLRSEKEDRRLWVDAICINQQNVDERNRQVRIMDQIYGRADSTAVYLGEHDEGSIALFEEAMRAEAAGFQIPRPSDFIAEQLKLLYQRPWFSRVWVLQEVFEKHVMVSCGASSISFHTLREVHSGYKVPYGLSITEEEMPQPFVWIYGLAHHSTGCARYDLWHLLFKTRESRATDPRDKIFALRSLIPSGSEIDHLINYSKTVEQCFYEVALFLISGIGLRILTANRHSHSKGMPSWVPDWSQNLPLGWLFAYGDTKSEESDIIGSPVKPLETCQAELCEDQLALRAKGCRYAKVATMSSVFSFDDAVDAVQQLRALAIGLETSLEAIHTNIALIDQLGEEIAKALWRLDLEELEMFLTRHWSCYSLSRYMSDGVLDISTGSMVHYFMSELQSCKLCLTDGGQLAIVPTKARKEDVFCVLMDADAACLLRQNADASWRLISGEAYLYVLGGSDVFQGAEFLEEYGDTLETFIIR